MIKRLSTLLAVFALQSAPAISAEPTIVVLGDSLSSGYGLDADSSWVAMLEHRLEGEAYGYDVVNASIAGDTSAGGLARLPRLLDTHEPAIVIVELGGNDGLRGQPVAKLRDNLAAIIEQVRASGAETLLTGIRIPPNYGPAYTEAFAGIYRELAADYAVPLVEFLMDGVALNPQLMQGDRIHPNAAGQAPMLENVWPVLVEMLDRPRKPD
jgi:acyl-CoA thioesterase I